MFGARRPPLSIANLRQILAILADEIRIITVRCMLPVAGIGREMTGLTQPSCQIFFQFKTSIAIGDSDRLLGDSSDSIAMECVSHQGLKLLRPWFTASD